MADAVHLAERRSTGAGWRSTPVLAVALAVMGILIAHRETVASIVAIWIRSETFAHGFVVVPICLGLVWRRREELAALGARPWWPGLVLVAVAGALWLVTSAADVLGGKQFALAFMVIGAIVTVVGLDVARRLLFPLAFLLFAVPAGEIFVPTLIEWTANFTIAALRISGVPVYREANHFIIPSGAWSVVEACSGVRYLIASVMVGTIYAAVTYRSTRRRVAFVAASIAVPLVANWLRAYLIVMLGHLSNNNLAVGVDHLIYGWLFFGVVMALLFWVGSFWREDETVAPAVAGPGPATRPATAERPVRLYAAAIAALAVAVLWRPVLAEIDQRQAIAPPVLGELAGAGPWRQGPALPSAWRPSYKGFAAEFAQAYAKGGDVAALYLAYYRDQAKGRELVMSGNALVTPGDRRWREVVRADGEVDWAGRRTPATRSEIVGNGESLAAWSLYWVDGRLTDSAYAAKAWLAWSKLAGRGGDSALIVVFAPKVNGRDVARDALQALSPEIDRLLDAARSGR